jgi:hypothetical protein
MIYKTKGPKVGLSSCSKTQGESHNLWTLRDNPVTYVKSSLDFKSAVTNQE